MRIDSQRIRAERSQRAWSQEHLAGVTDLGLRTIQRIETSGVASNESASAIAAALGVPVAELLVHRPAAPVKHLPATFATRRLWILGTVALVAGLASPPQMTIGLAALWAWLAVEILVATLSRRTPASSG